MRVSNRSVHFENLTFFPSFIPHTMDYRQKMVVASNQTHMKDDGEDDDDEDLEALRMAALQSLRPKDNTRTNSQPWQQTRLNTQQQIAQPHLFYKGQRPVKRPAYQAQPFRQNGGIYFQSHLTNPNLIAIVPVEEDVVLPESEPLRKLSDPESPSHTEASDESKFCRYRDDHSGSEEEDDGDRRGNTLVKIETETTAEEKGCSEPGGEISDTENTSMHDESPQPSEEDEKEEDDDDVLLMADLEEEDSLERLMDEMEKEMNVDKPVNVAVKRHSKKENRSMRKDETNRKQKERVKLEPRRTNRSSSPTVPSQSVPSVFKTEPRPLSPYNLNRPVHRRRSLSPKQRSRKKSPRKSPRRSPPRQAKKSQRDGGGREPLRFRSPRKSPLRFSPRPRSPRLSPRRSPPRLSPRSSPYLRSPCRLPRSRSPRISPRPRSPRILRSRSPRSPPRRSPIRLSPRKLSPRLLRSPKLSPRLRSPRLSPRRLSPRPRSPRISPRRISPRGRSPRMSPRVSPRRLSPRTRSPRLTPPRRISPRPRSPGISPHRSPWSSPRNSPRLSPRRRRSPKELARKIRPRSITPPRHQSPISRRGGSSPNSRVKNSVDESVKSKLKQKEESYEKLTSEDMGKSIEGVNNDPVLEARRRKFESTKPIDPVNANKKIKLSRKESKNEKSDLLDETETNSTNSRSGHKVTEEVVEEVEYETVETDSYPGVDFQFEDLQEPIEDSPTATIASTVNVCSEIEPAKLEREKPVKKKKKKDKELYQVHKSKGELPLSERIGKEKKCKKRKEGTADGPTEKTETIFGDLTVEEEEGDLRTELSRRRAERLNRSAPIHQQSVRLVQSAFKGVVSEVVKSNAKSIRKQLGKTDDKQNRKEVRRVTVLRRSVSDLHESEDETIVDPKVPVRFRLGLNKASQETRESKVSRKNSKRQSRKE